MALSSPSEWLCLWVAVEATWHTCTKHIFLIFNHLIKTTNWLGESSLRYNLWFSFFFKIFWLRWVSVVVHWLSLVAESRATLPCGVRASQMLANIVIPLSLYVTLSPPSTFGFAFIKTKSPKLSSACPSQYTLHHLNTVILNLQSVTLL